MIFIANKATNCNIYLTKSIEKIITSKTSNISTNALTNDVTIYNVPSYIVRCIIYMFYLEVCNSDIFAKNTGYSIRCTPEIQNF